MFTFQQDSASVHCARDMIELLRRSTPEFIAPEFSAHVKKRCFLILQGNVLTHAR